MTRDEAKNLLWNHCITYLNSSEAVEIKEEARKHAFARKFRWWNPIRYSPESYIVAVLGAMLALLFFNAFPALWMVVTLISFIVWCGVISAFRYFRISRRSSFVSLYEYERSLVPKLAIEHAVTLSRAGMTESLFIEVFEDEAMDIAFLALKCEPIDAPGEEGYATADDFRNPYYLLIMHWNNISKIKIGEGLNFKDDIGYSVGIKE